MRKRETSAETAARALALRDRPARALRRPDTRIVVDFAEPTLRAIHEALCDRIGSGDLGGDILNRTIIAEQMIGAALGEPSAWPDDPPLTDRGPR